MLRNRSLVYWDKFDSFPGFVCKDGSSVFLPVLQVIVIYNLFTFSFDDTLSWSVGNSIDNNFSIQRSHTSFSLKICDNHPFI